MDTASKRQYYTIIFVGALLAGGWVFREVLRLLSEGDGAVTLWAGGQVVGLAAMAWLLTTVVLFTTGVVIVRILL